MLTELFFVALLDMSLPEFQPEVDISGNVIVSEYDVSTGDVSAAEISIDDIAIKEDVPEGLSLGTSDNVIYMSRSVDSSSNDIVSAIQNLNTDNNNYWELFLDSYTVENHYSAVGVKLNNPTFKFSSSGQLQDIGNSTISVSYIPVMNNVTYTFTNLKPSNFNNFFLGVVDDIENPTVLYNFRLTQSYPSEFTVKPNIDGYFVVLMYANTTITFDANWTLIEQESYTLSELGNAVMEIKSSNDVLNDKIRSIRLLVLFLFIYPLAMSCVKLIGGKKDV